LIGEITQKINTIALTYAKMFVDGRRTNDIINLKDYINDIAHNVLSSISHDNIRLDIHASEVSTNLDIAIPLGLITNEVITNSIKHAFHNQPNPIITIYLKEQSDFIHYTIEDNGMGITESFSLENAHSLGSKIIYLLSQQLKSELYIDSSHGTKYSFRIKNLKTIHHENTNL
jgi:two-component sensor histidine kinase